MVDKIGLVNHDLVGDGREPRRIGAVQHHRVDLGPDSYSLLIVPPGVWNGFKGLADPLSVVANCCTHAHDPKRSARLDPFENDIGYDWAAKHH